MSRVSAMHLCWSSGHGTGCAAGDPATVVLQGPGGTPLWGPSYDPVSGARVPGPCSGVVDCVSCACNHTMQACIWL